MSLPKISHVHFSTTLPSGAAVTYRPFTGREQKALLVAKESGETADVMRAIIEVLTSCCDGYDVGKLPVFDLEYLFLIVRAKSVGGKVDVVITDDDGVKHDAVVNIEDAEVEQPKQKPDKNVTVVDGVVVSLKFPTAREISEVPKNADEWDYLAMSVEGVTHGEEFFAASDLTKTELRDWLQTLPLSAIGPIKTFFEVRPKVALYAVYQKEGKTHKKKVTGVHDFFV